MSCTKEGSDIGLVERGRGSYKRTLDVRARQTTAKGKNKW